MQLISNHHAGQLIFIHHFNILSSLTEGINIPAGHTTKFCIFPLFPLSCHITLPETLQWVHVQVQPIHMHPIYIY